MKHQLVIKEGLLSEKIYAQMESGIYTFLVSREATKNDVKKSVETQFKVKVKKVNVLNRTSKKRRVTGTRKMVNTQGGKKAVVYLQAGQSIALLSPKSQKKPPENKKNAKSPDTETKKKGLLSRITKSKKEKVEGK
ncbi:MAG: 50S ribosomal protein L23 [Candidatus Curtissbacteria bacterium GW2011_GWA1_40_9]|uniref:Large ribosomal subunit protein uL23 n=1 Tax=Candidatus Curtissbacteria bacterium GW2011_GWA1_40_9 TaxID=1618408 RepID=A0A0G0TM15_9BACT|nr:MAG: 50S ribosomal protein L23 [Candidatus Curtissbacteria bacterium GW2011_GWA1_40_9]